MEKIPGVNWNDYEKEPQLEFPERTPEDTVEDLGQFVINAADFGIEDICYCAGS
jgi:hypothetical protein